MSHGRLPKSLRKYIRAEKARIRRTIGDMADEERQIQQLYEQVGIKKQK